MITKSEVGLEGPQSELADDLLVWLIATVVEPEQKNVIRNRFLKCKVYPVVVPVDGEADPRLVPEEQC